MTTRKVSGKTEAVFEEEIGKIVHLGRRKMNSVNRKRTMSFEEIEHRSVQLFRRIVRTLTEKRIQAGMSQKELALRAKVSVSFLCDLECERKLNPSWNKLALLCEAVGTPLPQLVLEAACHNPAMSAKQRSLMKELADVLVTLRTSEFVADG